MEGEENQVNQMQETVEEPEAPKNPDVGFPLQPKPKAGINKWVLIVLGLLILGGGGVFLFTRGSSNQEPSPTPTVAGVTQSPSPTPTPSPTDKTKVKIEIQNGTGISGEAAYLQGVLKNLGYSNITAGNADNQDYTTTIVTFGKNVGKDVVDEVTKKLEEVYKTVETKTSSTQKVDILIVTGLRKGATAKPSPSPSPKVSPTASPSATPSASPTPRPSGQ